MAVTIGKYAAKKLLNKEMKKYKNKKPAGQYDPYFVEIDDPRRPGRKKKVKKQIPDYIPDHDAEILAKVRKRAYHLDMSLFDFLGVRFGWSSVIGLIPEAGDVADAAMAVVLVAQCNKVECGLGSYTFGMMILNVIIDFFIGTVPFIGDLADAGFKANTRNVRLLENRLDKVYKPRNVSVPANHPATVFEELDDSDDERLPRHQPAAGGAAPTRPEVARVPAETRGGAGPDSRPSRSGLGFFGGGNRKDRRADVEMAQAGPPPSYTENPNLGR